ncbi:sensor domain-containing diguanylate cyclase [Paludibacterium paludis]|uniref:diguanylate cyclase n=1 Tax=Paludibacterium paludis TaxID=1225769 RepID=A0A918P1P8_9NEIS|nr:diguanylate cyclase [Paludibacterium paludis]GGY12701.1 hypothetical protein GCM10011289_14990 [Paludibacterium paludis]
MELPVSRAFPAPWGGAVLTLFAYLAAGALLCGGLAPEQAAPCLIWLPAGIALASVILWGAWMAAPIFIASLLFTAWQSAAGPTTWFAIPCFNTAGSLLGGLLVRKRRTQRLPVFRVVDAVSLLGLGIGVSAIVSAFGGIAVPGLQEGARPVIGRYADWWISDMAGAAACAPLLLFCMARDRICRAGEAVSWAETALVSLVTLTLAFLVYFRLDGMSGRYEVWPVLLLLPLLWAATRLPLLLAQLLGSAVMLMAVFASARGIGAFHAGPPGLQSDNTALMVLVQSAILLIIGAQVAERRDAEDSARQANLWLERKVAERSRALAESEARFRDLADTAPVPLAVSRFGDGSVLYVNQKAREMFQVEDSPFSLCVEDFYVSRSARAQILERLDALEYLQDHEMELKDSLGRQFWAMVSCTLIRRDGEKQIIIGISDISSRKVREQSLQMANRALQAHLVEVESRHQGLRDQAMRDPLTGLFNRRFLDQVLPEHVSLCRFSGSQLAIVMIDVDHFKTINDTWGHRGGDDVLATLGAYLSDQFRSSDLVCRYGGEEFVVVMPDTPPDMAQARAVELCEMLRTKTFYANGHPISITMSVGMAAFPLHGDDAGPLLLRADEALYQAKREGRDRVVVASVPRA